MLSDSLDELVRRLVGTSAPGAHVIRLTQVGLASAEEASRLGGHSVADADVERMLEVAGLELERGGGEGQPSPLVWARLDRVARAGERPAGRSRIRGERTSPQVTFYCVEAAEVRQAAANAHWLVEAHCWRRGPDGSIAVYGLSTRRPFQRGFESEAETIDDATAAGVAGSIIQQMAIELMPLVVRAVSATQGNDPDLRPERDRLS